MESKNMVKVCLLGDSLIMQALERVVKFTTNNRIVATEEEADLVIAEKIGDIEANFSGERRYAIITVDDIMGHLPDNVTVFQAPFELRDYFRFVAGVSVSERTIESAEIDAALLSTDAERILVIDDSLRNRVSARKSLAGHKLTVAKGYEDGMKIIGEQEFDVVLTDLYLPMSSYMISSSSTFRLGELVPYGFLLMCEAAHRGAKHVAIVTDGNHHTDCISAAFDHFSRLNFNIDGANVRMLFAQINEDGSKDWGKALNTLLTL